MTDINQVLQDNGFKVKQLLRRFHIIGEPNMDSIQKGFDKHGERFMLQLLEIITPSSPSFSNTITPISPILTSAPVDTKTLMPVNSADPSKIEGNTKFWSFWNNLLTGIGQTGEALGKFKSDVANNPTEQVYTPEQIAKQANNTKVLYMVAGGFVLLIILILILRK